ncbi:MAG: hypothetical protein KBT39_02195 [Bacteroidales bacterium]|nr:hypothetical protein [Bacteroidales bacterium]
MLQINGTTVNHLVVNPQARSSCPKNFINDRCKNIDDVVDKFSYTDDIVDELVDIEKNRYTGRQGINEAVPRDKETVPRDKEAKQGIKNNTESQIRDKVTKRQ